MLESQRDDQNPPQHHNDHLECIIVDIAGLAAEGAIPPDDHHPDHQADNVGRPKQRLEHQAHGRPLRHHVGEDADENDGGAQGPDPFIAIQCLEQVRNRQRPVFFAEITHRLRQQAKHDDVGQNGIDGRQAQQRLIAQIVTETRQPNKEKSAGDGGAGGKSDEHGTHLSPGHDKIRHVLLCLCGQIAQPDHNGEIRDKDADNYRMSHSSSRPSLYKNP